MSNASEKDKYIYCDHSTDTIESTIVDWLEPGSDHGATATWYATGGTIATDGVFHPGQSPNSNATVWVDIHDPEEAGAPGETDRKTYSGNLKVFKVGIRVQPGAADFWEDDDLLLKGGSLESGPSKLYAFASTGLASTTDDDDTSSGWSGHAEWKTITEPGNAGTAIQKEIVFQPAFIGSGGMQVRDHNSFFADVGSGSVSANVLAVAGALPGTPFTKAAVSIVTTISSGWRHGRTSGTIGGASTIKYVADGSFSTSVISTPQQYLPTTRAIATLASMSASGSASDKEGVTFEGDYEAKSKVMVIDNTPVSRGEAVINQSGMAAPKLDYVATRPEYR